MAFDPDAYLAKKESPKQAIPFDPDAYLAKKDQEDSVLNIANDIQEESFDWENPMSSLAKKAGEKGLQGLQYLGEKYNEYIDPYTGGPVRAGLLAGAKGENPLTAATKQFGQPGAPSGKQVVEELGVPGTALSEKFPELYSETGEGIKLQKGGLLDPTAAGTAGFAVDVLADPLTFVPAGKLTGFLGKGAKTVEEAPKALKGFSEGKAISQAGGMLKDFRKLANRNKMEDVGQTLLKETVDIADEAGNIKKVPLLSIGDDVEEIATKAAEKQKQVGQSLKDLYKDAQEKVNSYILGKADPKVLKKLGDSTPTITNLKTEVVPQIKTVLKGQAKSGPIRAVENYLDDILLDYGDKPLDLLDLHEIKSKIGKEINWNKAEFPNRDVAFQEVYKNLSKKIDDHMSALDEVYGKTGDLKKLDSLKDLNKKYSSIAEITKMSEDKVARNLANRMVSPSDYGSGIGGAVIGTTASGPVGGLLTALGATAANNALRKYGPGILAKGSASVGKGLEKAAPLLSNTLTGVRELDRPIIRGLLRRPTKDNEKEQ